MQARTFRRGNPNWWRKYSALERCLTLIIILAITFNKREVEAGLKLFQNQSETLDKTYGSMRTTVNLAEDGANITGTETGICKTTQCILSASEILSKMKPEIQPCDDFYQFVCGRYIDKETIPEDKQVLSLFVTIIDDLQKQIKDILTEERPPTDPQHLRLPNALYNACTNTTFIETLGAEPIKNISDSMGGWPVIEGAEWGKYHKWTWQETIKHFRRNGIDLDYIIKFSVEADLKNNTKRIIQLDQPSFGLSREYLIMGPNDTFVSAYYNYMVDIAVLFGADRRKAERELKESLNFEIQLANISLPQEARHNQSELYNLRTVKQLQTAYPYVQWLNYMNALLPEGLTIEENEIINLSVPSFFDKLGALLTKTPKRVIANYLMWRIHDYSTPFLSDKFRQRKLKYDTVMNGKTEQEPRWKECVALVNDNLKIAVSSLYIERHFNQVAKANALEIVDNIRVAFDHLLNGVSWMDNTTKMEAKKKLRAIKPHIGYPDEMLDRNKVEKYYQKLDMDPTKFFESFLKIKIFDMDNTFNKLRLPVNKTDWTQRYAPTTINAFYNDQENSMEFPAGILQHQFYNADRPKYMNYGAIGYIIAHEITHGFDEKGRQFDTEGNVADWWRAETRETYLRRATCIIEQYGNYTDKLSNMTLNGINTLSENIADNGGIKVAYNGYRQWAASNAPEPKLPGLDYTPQQMFWISAGQIWCAKIRKELLKTGIATLQHSTPEFRVLGPLRNMKDFSKDFQCPEGSPMNPIHKCEVW